MDQSKYDCPHRYCARITNVILLYIRAKVSVLGTRTHSTRILYFKYLYFTRTCGFQRDSNCHLYSYSWACTVYPKKYAHGFCFAVLCCGYTLTDFPISIRLTSLALWQSNDCPSASKATLMNMDKYFMWIHYERMHNHNKAKHNKTVCIFLGIYCTLIPVRLLTRALIFYATFAILVMIWVYDMIVIST